MKNKHCKDETNNRRLFKGTGAESHREQNSPDANNLILICQQDRVGVVEGLNYAGGATCAPIVVLGAASGSHAEV